MGNRVVSGGTQIQFPTLFVAHQCGGVRKVNETIGQRLQFALVFCIMAIKGWVHRFVVDAHLNNVVARFAAGSCQLNPVVGKK